MNRKVYQHLEKWVNKVKDAPNASGFRLKLPFLVFFMTSQVSLWRQLIAYRTHPCCLNQFWVCLQIAQRAARVSEVPPLAHSIRLFVLDTGCEITLSYGKRRAMKNALKPIYG